MYYDKRGQYKGQFRDGSYLNGSDKMLSLHVPQFCGQMNDEGVVLSVCIARGIVSLASPRDDIDRKQYRFYMLQDTRSREMYYISAKHRVLR